MLMTKIVKYDIYKMLQVDLALILVLKMTTISTSVQQSLPRVSHIKAMDVWAFSCLFFVCASLLEIALVNILTQKETKRKEKRATKKIEKGENDLSLQETMNEQTWNTSQAHNTCMHERIRMCSRVIFPLTFTLFNVIYWWWYLSKFTKQQTADSSVGKI